jgi:N5-(cytidine 5'-diphosphoramidyl)-L-glutamine hydrolase
VTQRVAIEPRNGERRDCLDQRWAEFLLACGLAAVPLPNSVAAATALISSLPIAGLVLSGGNDLAAYGGDAPERDATENAVIELVERMGLPVFGVCRGMQLVQHRFGVPLHRVSGHVAPRQTISIDGAPIVVNSFHNIGTTENRPPLEVWAVAEDGTVKAVRHPSGRLSAVMWHPERMSPFATRDIETFQRFFGAGAP